MSFFGISCSQGEKYRRNTGCIIKKRTLTYEQVPQYEE